MAVAFSKSARQWQLNLLIGLHRRFGVDIREADCARLTALQAIVAYLLARAVRPGA